MKKRGENQSYGEALIHSGAALNKSGQPQNHLGVLAGLANGAHL